MNDFYLRKNGKAIIFDEEGVETSREYEDKCLYRISDRAWLR